MDIQKHINHWFEGAESDLIAAEIMFNNGHYNYCLFIGHLVLEKALKGVYVKVLKAVPPKTHNLVFLANKINLKITKEQEKFLFEVNAFNIETRYSDYKTDFYKKCTKEFAHENFENIKVIYKWIKEQL
ncbi:MAG: HEPN domain-containing protein [Ignavibacteriae bacterium]|nr:MAG: HEPN domain-containing protein [Ignavibacteriota bacterium]